MKSITLSYRKIILNAKQRQKRTVAKKKLEREKDWLEVKNFGMNLR